MAFNLADITASIRGLASQARKLRSDIEKARREHDEIAAAPAARQDVKAAVRGLIAANADRYNTLAGRALAPLIGKASLLADPERVATTFGPMAAAAPGGQGLQPRALDMLLAAVAGEAVGAALDKVIDNLPWPAAEGLPAAQRVVELQRLEKHIAGLEAQESALRAEARAAGVLLED